MFHHFDSDISQESLPERLNCPTNYTPHPLAQRAARQLMSYLESHTEWKDELANGKMFGVLVVKNGENVGFLAAFSGNLDGRSTIDYFVPPIYDCQAPEGTFKREERNISIINNNINKLINSDKRAEAAEKLQKLLSESEGEIANRKEQIRQNKIRREQLRSDAQLSDDEKAELIRESQHEKAELHRYKLLINRDIDDARLQLKMIDEEIEQLRNQRHKKSIILQRWLFSQYLLTNGLGRMRTIGDIFRTDLHRDPPSGTGECAAPKLLQFAIRNNMKPIALAEFWYGKSPLGVVRQHGAFYPACHQKCEPILRFMLQGIDYERDKRFDKTEEELQIIYEDEHILVIIKPSGLASVDGNETSDSAERRIAQYLGRDGHFVVHRLDMETSGLLLAAKDDNTFSLLRQQFERRLVSKKYIAVIDGEIANNEGVIDIPLRPDIDDRPRQIVDYEHGKQAISKYKIINRENGRTRVGYQPLTGRTHQLRVHSVVGLGYPIVGDRLYGSQSSSRLLLHAAYLEFTHPITNQKLQFSSDAPF